MHETEAPLEKEEDVAFVDAGGKGEATSDLEEPAGKDGDLRGDVA